MRRRPFIFDKQHKMASLTDYKAFLIENHVLTTAAGITFGQASLQLIKSFVADLMLPLVYMLCSVVVRVVNVTRGATVVVVGGGGRKGARTPPVLLVPATATPVSGGGFLAKVLLQKELKFSNFIAELITFTLVIVTAYLFITYLFRSYILQNRGDDKGAIKGGDADAGAGAVDVSVEGWRQH